MANKETLLKMIDAELSSIINQCEKREEILVAEVNSLKEQIVSLEKENNELASQLKNKEDDAKAYVDRLDNDITYELIDELCLSPSLDNARQLLRICGNLFDDENVEILIYVFELLQHNKSIGDHEEPGFQEQFIRLVEKVLLGTSIKDTPEEDRLLSSVIGLLIELNQASSNNAVSIFIEERHDDLFERVLSLNEPSLITKYLRLLMEYEFTDVVKRSMQHILDVEWGFIDSSLTRNDFIFLLWYSYLFDYDEDLIDLGSISLQWFDDNVNELALYFYLYDEDKLEKDTYLQKVSKFNKGTVLTPKEKDIILRKVKKNTLGRFDKQMKAPVYYDSIFVIQDKWEPYFLNKGNLQKQFISLPLYRNKRDNLAHAFVDKKVLIDKDRKRVYITESDLNKITKKYKLFPKSQNVNSNHFAWPSTELTGEKGNERDENTLSEKSALMLMGYKVSGKMTRAKRWEILQKRYLN
ncbi:hypothetical protein KJK41_04320 [Bacillus haikouensis]|nr:hypothetical protein KJK41_04320 [Bacillus haikouensis]